MSQSWGGGGGGNWGGPPPGGWGPPPAPPPGGGYGPPPPGGGYGPPPGGFAPPPPGYPPGYTPMASGGAVAWEDKSRGLFSRWWGTVKEACLNSRPFHAAAAQSEDPWPAVTFAITNGGIVGLVGGIFFAVVYGAIGGLGALSAMSAGGRGAAPAGAAVFGIIAAMGVGVAVFLPLMYIAAGLVMPWIMGGLHHLALAMVGGTSKPYSSTVRVVAYATAGQILSFVPMVGGMLSLAVWVISLVVGFDETHRCGTGKALAGALLPLVFFGVCCCGCYIMLFVVGAAAGSHR